MLWIHQLLYQSFLEKIKNYDTITIKLIKFKVGLKFSINQLTKLTFRFPSPPNSSSDLIEAHSLSWRAEVTDTCELIINRL